MSSFGHFTTFHVPTLTETADRVVNHGFTKLKKPGPDKIYCECCFTTYSMQELKERHQAKYTSMICKKCFSYSTQGLSVMLQQHMAAHHQMLTNKTGHHVTDDDHGWRVRMYWRYSKQLCSIRVFGMGTPYIYDVKQYIVGWSHNWQNSVFLMERQEYYIGQGCDLLDVVYTGMLWTSECKMLRDEVFAHK